MTAHPTAATRSTRPSLAAILIVHDEEDNIADCLASLAFCDAIVVVDGGSKDRTVEIARAAGATVAVRSDWQGFGIQKQRALDLAQTDYVLSIDADERVGADLAAAIGAAIVRGDRAGWRVGRLNGFLGGFLRHGGWYPDRVLRLARREAARFSPAIVHEELLVDGPVGDIAGDLLHHSYRTIDDVLRKMRTYALASAEVRRKRGRRGGLGAAMLRSVFAFLKAYLLQAGFLDGRRGLVAAIFRAQETFWRYLALGWEARR
jgi:glycosyltransferase involved in cell wall biosynthesis